MRTAGRISYAAVWLHLMLWLSQLHIPIVAVTSPNRILDATTMATTLPANATAQPRPAACYQCAYNRGDDPSIIDDNCLYLRVLPEMATCLASDQYCMTHIESAWGQVQTLTRKCSGYCPYGCSYSKYGLTLKICNKCCVDAGCNLQRWYNVDRKQPLDVAPGMRSASSTVATEWSGIGVALAALYWGRR